MKQQQRRKVTFGLFNTERIHIYEIVEIDWDKSK